MTDTILALTGRQLKAARILAAFDRVEDLAAEAGLALATVQRLEHLENSLACARLDTIGAIVTALASRGVFFVPGGVQGDVKQSRSQAATLPKLAEVVTA
jgi:hypothetical protein